MTNRPKKRVAKRPKLFGVSRKIAPLDISEFPHPKPTMEIVSYSGQIQRMLSNALDNKRTVVIRYKQAGATAYVTHAAIGSDGRATYILEIKTFDFFDSARRAKRNRAS